LLRQEVLQAVMFVLAAVLLVILTKKKLGRKNDEKFSSAKIQSTRQNKAI